jgi:arsenical pump membrane protein
MWVLALALLGAAALWRPHATGRAGAATAGPFLTLAGVILAAAGLEAAGVFRWMARRLVPDDLSPRHAFARVLILVALVSGLINLDVAVVVAMPVALRAAERTGIPSSGFAIAVAITANAASILLPTSNLTNLLVMSRTPLTTGAYLQASWIAWLGFLAVTVLILTGLLTRGSGGPADHHEVPIRPLSLSAIWDLVPMFLGATGIRALLGTGLHLTGGFFEQAAAGSLLAAGLNNLPAAAAVHPLSAAGAWAAVVAMAIGPNLFFSGSVATVICRRLARGAGGDLDPVRFSLVGWTLVPAQVVVAFAGLRLARVV